MPLIYDTAGHDGTLAIVLDHRLGPSWVLRFCSVDSPNDSLDVVIRSPKNSEVCFLRFVRTDRPSQGGYEEAEKMFRSCKAPSRTDGALLVCRFYGQRYASRGFAVF